MKQTVRTRMAEYRAKTAPILPFYEARGLVRRVDGMKSPSSRSPTPSTPSSTADAFELDCASNGRGICGQFLFAGLLVLSAPAAAEVVSADAARLRSPQAASTSSFPCDQAYAAFGRIGAWWSDGHTYSGKAANMTPGAERRRLLLRSHPESGGGVEHMRGRGRPARTSASS